MCITVVVCEPVNAATSAQLVDQTTDVEADLFLVGQWMLQLPLLGQTMEAKTVHFSVGL